MDLKTGKEFSIIQMVEKKKVAGLKAKKMENFYILHQMALKKSKNGLMVYNIEQELVDVYNYNNLLE